MGVFSSLVTMAFIYIYSNRKELKEKLKDRKKQEGEKKTMKQRFEENRNLLYALSPWVILVLLVSVASIVKIEEFLMNDLLGDVERIDIKGDINDLNIFTQVYTWILIATFLAFPFL